MRSLLAAFLWFSLASARTAQAQTAVTLDWTAPPDCPSGDAITRAVATLVNALPPTPIRARAAVERRSPGFSLHLALGEGERELTASTCAELAQTLVVILALAVDPHAKTDVTVAFPEAPPEEPPAATKPRAPPGNASSVTKAAPAAQRVELRRAPRKPSNTEARESRANEGESARAPFELGASLLFLGEIGTLPAASYGPGAIVWLRRSSFAAELGATVLLPQFAQAPGVPTEKGGEIWLAAGQLSGCWFPRRELRLAACAGGEVGRLTGDGEGVDHERQVDALWVAALATAVLRAPLSARFSLEARLAVVIPATRPEFGLDGYDPFYVPSAVSGRGSVGLAFE